MSTGGTSARRPACLFPGIPILLALVLLGRPAGAREAGANYLRELTARARERRLAGERKWLRLMHALPSGRGWRSEADGASFFLAPDGRTDLAAELDADLAAFFEPEPAQGQHPQCRFPARYHWLKEKLAFDPALLPERPCPDFEAWRDAIGAESVSVVFASAFLNNPASMYGHTFLRLHRKGGGDALLDYTINFAASPDTKNALVYTLKGLNGSFKGEYSLMPFYLKTQEYENLEMRDLWDYPLNLNADAVADLVRHGWEMGSTHFNYYFFTKNCSYQLLTLMEAADDSLDLRKGFRLGVIPADTVRALMARPGLVGTPRYRPSFVSEIIARRGRLSADEAAAATRLGDAADDAGLRSIARFPKERQALILESAHDYLRYRNGFDSRMSTRTATALHELLRARGRLGLPPVETTVPAPLPLEAGHDTARIGLGSGVTARGGFQELSLRRALHDLSAPDDGYIPGSELVMGSARLRYDDQRRYLSVEQLELARIVSLSPWDRWVRKPSWKLSLSAEQAKELNCSGSSCLYGALDAGAGLSARVHAGRDELFYILGETDLDFGAVLPQDWRAGAGASAGVIVDLAPHWRAHAEATYIDYAQRSPPRQRLRLTNSLRLTRDLELRVTLDRRVPDEEAGAMFYVHF